MNRACETGTAHIEAYDARGRVHGPATLSLRCRQARHFDAADLERDIGDGEGDWWLRVSSELDIDVLPFVRAADGFTTPMHGVVPPDGDLDHHVAFFSPASDDAGTGRLRLVNTGPWSARPQILGTDDEGRVTRYHAVVDVPRSRAIDLAATEIEQGSDRVIGFGDGSGTWRLDVQPDRQMLAMSLLESPTGHLVNVSASKTPNVIAFPKHGFPVTATLGDDPIRTQTATGGLDTGPTTYSSTRPDVAMVDPASGTVTPVGIGGTVISAHRPASENLYAATARYRLWVEPVRGDVVDVRVFEAPIRFPFAHYVATYASGLAVDVQETIGPVKTVGRKPSCQPLGLRPGNLKHRRETRTHDGHPLDDPDTSCEPTEQDRPEIPTISPTQVAVRLQGATTFAPEYVADHGKAVQTTVESFNIGTAATRNYESGLEERVVRSSFNEVQQGRDYNDDGDKSDRINLIEVFWDGYPRRREIHVSDENGGPVEERYVQKSFRTPRRIALPEDVPAFLKFNGNLRDVVVHIADGPNEGEYYVKVDSDDPDRQLIVTRDHTDTLRPGHFADAPLIGNAETARYSVFVIEGELHEAVLAEYPNFRVRKDHTDFLIPTLLRNALDGNRNIVVHADVPEFLAHYDAAPVVYDPARDESSFEQGTIIIGAHHVYAPRPLIHEACHSYHEFVLPDGYDNTEVLDMYALVPRDTDQPYGDEQNSYWRLNAAEFFAEGCTTYVYLESGLTFDIDPLSQVDSYFYYATLEPYFDALFKPHTESANRDAASRVPSWDARQEPGR